MTTDSTAEGTALLGRLQRVLADVGTRAVACSGGIDSLLLATVAHQHDPRATSVVHTMTPAVPGEATARVVAHGRTCDWDLHLVRSGEFDDERYLSNPTDRCYYCKTNLYDAVAEVSTALSSAPSPDRTVISGANLDDLGEYRPGLTAAAEHAVRHPYVEAEMAKADIRTLARHLGVAEAELPASPCLASRIYTGTRVTEARLRAIELGEAVLRSAGIGVVRCRVDEAAVRVEVPDEDRHLVTPALIDDVAKVMTTAEPGLVSVVLDELAYRPGRAFLHVTAFEGPTR